MVPRSKFVDVGWTSLFQRNPSTEDEWQTLSEERIYASSSKALCVVSDRQGRHHSGPVLMELVFSQTDILRHLLRLSVAASMLKFDFPLRTYSVNFCLLSSVLLGPPDPGRHLCRCLHSVRMEGETAAVNHSDPVQHSELDCSTSLCFMIARSTLAAASDRWLLALVAAVHFATSTVMVSAFLPLTNESAQVYQFYFWSFRIT